MNRKSASLEAFKPPAKAVWGGGGPGRVEGVVSTSRGRLGKRKTRGVLMVREGTAEIARAPGLLPFCAFSEVDREWSSTRRPSVRGEEGQGGAGGVCLPVRLGGSHGGGGGRARRRPGYRLRRARPTRGGCDPRRRQKPKRPASPLHIAPPNPSRRRNPSIISLPPSLPRPELRMSISFRGDC